MSATSSKTICMGCSIKNCEEGILTSQYNLNSFGCPFPYNNGNLLQAANVTLPPIWIQIPPPINFNYFQAHPLMTSNETVLSTQGAIWAGADSFSFIPCSSNKYIYSSCWVEFSLLIEECLQFLFWRFIRLLLQYTITLQWNM